MFRLFRLLVVCFVVVIISLTLDTQITQARWLRTGDDAHLYSIDKVCPDGFQISLAYSWPDQQPPYPGDRYVYAFDRSYYEPGAQRRAAGRLGLFYHDTPITGLPFDPPPAPPWEVPYANCYDTSFIPWTIVPDFNDYGSVELYWFISPTSQDAYFALGTIRRGDIGDCSINESVAPSWDPKDGRANVNAGASAVIYCEDAMVKVYSVDGDSQGSLSFAVLIAEINIPEIPLHNTLIASGPNASGGEIRLYRLTTGEWQITAPGLPPESWKEYVFIWNGC